MRLKEMKKLIESSHTSLNILLGKLLQLEYFKSLPDDENISLATLVFFLQANYKQLSDKVLDNEAVDNDLINLFLNPQQEIKEEASKEVEKNAIAKLSVAPKLILFQSNSQDKIWEEKFIALGCHKKIIAKIFALKLIKNHEKLYKAVNRFNYPSRNRLQVWELCCLSGDLGAIRYAVKNENLNQYKGLEGTWNIEELINPLLLMALSGVVQAVDYGINILKIPVNTESRLVGMSILRFAAWSGDVDTINFCQKNAIDYVENYRPENSFQNCVVRSSSLKACKQFLKETNLGNAIDSIGEGISLELFKIITKDMTKIHGSNFYRVIRFGDIPLIEYCINSLGADPQAQDFSGKSLLYAAIESCDLKKVQYCINTLKIIPSPSDYNNPLYAAAEQGWVDGMRYACEVLKFNPYEKNRSGESCLYLVCKSGNCDAILYCINELNLDLELQSQSNPLDLVIRSGNTEAVKLIRIMANKQQVNLRESKIISTLNTYNLKNPEEIKNILEAPIEKLLAEENDSLFEEKSLSIIARC